MCMFHYIRAFMQNRYFVLFMTARNTWLDCLPLRSSYGLEKPARPRPNLTLGGTNCMADMAPARDSISASLEFLSFDFASIGEVFEAALAMGPLLSSVEARRRCSFVCDTEDRRLPWPPSTRSDLLPSIPSFVMAKK